MLSFNEELIKYLSLAIELAGIAAVILGAVWAVVIYLSRIWSNSLAYQEFRAHLGRGILIGLDSWWLQTLSGLLPLNRHGIVWDC